MTSPYQDAYRAALEGVVHAHSRQLDRLEDEIADLKSNLLALGHHVALLRAAVGLDPTPPARKP